MSERNLKKSGNAAGRGERVDAAGWGWWMHVTAPWLAGGALLAAGLAAGLAFAPGVPAGWRPQNVYRQWHYDRLFEAGLAAEKRGEIEVARVSFLAAADSWPGALAPHFQVVRMLTEKGRLDEAMEAARGAGLDGPALVHDVLLLGGRFEELLRHSMRLLGRESGREGVWLASSRLAALMLEPRALDAVRSEPSPELDAAMARGSLDALLAAAATRKGEVGAALARRERAGPLGPAEVMSGLDAWLDAGDPGEAFVWLNRHRGSLGDFDALLADFRIEQARASVFAPGMLEAFGRLPLSEGRWVRLAAAVLEGGLSEGALLRLEQVAKRAGLEDSPAVCVALWSFAATKGRTAEAGAWEASYRKSGGVAVPAVLVRGLDDEDREKRARAVLLLSKETPFPRELLHGVLKRPLGSEGPPPNVSDANT